MDYKTYYAELKDKLKKYSDVIYYEPMSENEILEIEKRMGVNINPMYREYLAAFGMIQDIFGRLETNVDCFVEDYDFYKYKLPDYLILSTEVEEEDSIFILNNTNPNDDCVYMTTVDENDTIGERKKFKPFLKIIEEGVSELEKNYKHRCHNKDKVSVTEFTITGNDFPAFAELFKAGGLMQKTDWGLREHDPDNLFGGQEAIFDLFGNEIVIERDKEFSEYIFRLDEPILTSKEESIIHKAEQLLISGGIKYEKFECRPIDAE